MHRPRAPHLRRCSAYVIGLLLFAVLACREDAAGPTSGEMEKVMAPEAAATQLSFRQVSAGRLHACGVTTDNLAYCWGFNDGNRLGIGGNTAPETCEFGRPLPCSSRPMAVAGALQFRSLSAGESQTCGVTTGERIYCWGVGYSGNGTTAIGPTPVRLAGTRRYHQVAVGDPHICALDTSGQVYCWGYNGWGQLGDGTTTERLTPVRVQAGALRFRRLTVGSRHTCAIATNDRLYCWGLNNFGQIGDRSKTDRLTPVPVSGGLAFKDVSGGLFHTCAITPENRGYCWGWADNGQLGDGTNWTRRLKPVPVLGGLTLTRVTAGHSHTCGQTATNRAYCWGNNGFVELGDGTTTSRSTPVAVDGGLSFTQVSANEVYTCGVAGTGVAYCWGNNRWGQLGDGTRLDREVPTRVEDPI
jgi:alpha-tubulin suppressor-like RCC1 family protein